MNNNQIIKAKMCLSAIQRASRLLGINIPEVYFINETPSRTELYSHELKFVSEDLRDIGYVVEKIRFIPKEYVIYINTRIFDNEVQMLCHCYQTTRYAYQIEEVRKYRNNLHYRDSLGNLRMWDFCFSEARNVKGITHSNSPSATDMIAFAYLMIRKYHHININFKNINEKDFYSAVDDIQRNIQILL